MKKLFTEGFTAMDIAEPLVSFDADRSASDVRRFTSEKGLGVVGVRTDGVTAGYVEQEDLAEGNCGDSMRCFDEGNVLSETASYPHVIDCLSGAKYCFISTLGNVAGIITRGDIQKPPVRMWLFGMITILEMFVGRTVEARFPNDTWRKELSQGRLRKAEDLQDERKRRNQQVKLLDCLHLSDKMRILVKDPVVRKDAGLESVREAEKMARELESLRNNLVHAHDIVTYDWDTIVTVSKRLDRIMTRI
jgi:hypothetical protein